jgi:hypothetical protein
MWNSLLVCVLLYACIIVLATWSRVLCDLLVDLAWWISDLLHITHIVSVSRVTMLTPTPSLLELRTKDVTPLLKDVLRDHQLKDQAPVQIAALCTEGQKNVHLDIEYSVLTSGLLKWPERQQYRVVYKASTPSIVFPPYHVTEITNPILNESISKMTLGVSVMAQNRLMRQFSIPVTSKLMKYIGPMGTFYTNTPAGSQLDPHVLYCILFHEIELIVMHAKTKMGFVQLESGTTPVHVKTLPKRPIMTLRLTVVQRDGSSSSVNLDHFLLT